MARLKAPQDVVEGEFKLVDGTEGLMVEESGSLREEVSPLAETTEKHKEHPMGDEQRKII